MKWILTDTDRHFNNFGVLRDTKTLAFVGMAPIFDSGNSMFWKNPKLPEYDDLTDITVSSFRNTERQLLGLITSHNQVNISKLPTEDDLRGIYAMDLLIPYVDSIVLGYQKKIQSLL